jgi:hypothetical protein
MNKKYRLVCYLRVDPDIPEPMTYADAVREKEHCELLHPENIYRVEKIEPLPITRIFDQISGYFRLPDVRK